MKNNKILYILTLIITLFSFNTNVYAAQELTCIYQMEKTTEKFILTQDTAGILKLYSNNAKVGINNSGWTLKSTTSSYNNNSSYSISLFEDVVDNNSSLSKCPEFSIFRDKTVEFYNDENNWVKAHNRDNKMLRDREKLAQELKINIEPSIVGVSNVNDAQELTCVYGADWNKEGRKLVLTQKKDGTRKMYVNYSKNISFQGPGWGEALNVPIDISGVKDKNNAGDLNSCPRYVGTYSDRTTFVDEGEPIKYNSQYSTNKVEEIVLSLVLPKNNVDPEKDLLIDTNEKFSASCKFRTEIENGEYHYIQLNYGKDALRISEYDPGKIDKNGVNYSGYASVMYDSYIYSLEISEKFTIANLLRDWNGDCPPALVVSRFFSEGTTVDTGTGFVTLPGGGVGTVLLKHVTAQETVTSGQKLYHLMNDPESNGVVGTNPINGGTLGVDQTHNIEIEFLTPEINNCSDLLGEEIADYLNTVWNIVKFGVPIILLGLGTVDFAQAVFAGKDDGMKKAQGKFIKRIIIAIAIFLVPTLITFLLNIANNIWGGIGADLCGVIF